MIPNAPSTVRMLNASLHSVPLIRIARSVKPAIWIGTLLCPSALVVELVVAISVVARVVMTRRILVREDTNAVSFGLSVRPHATLIVTAPESAHVKVVVKTTIEDIVRASRIQIVAAASFQMRRVLILDRRALVSWGPLADRQTA